MTPRLTAEQRDAATASAAWVHVEAGPGTGKTTVLAARVAHLIADRDVPPDRILALVFTRSAAENIRTRVAAALRSPEVASRVNVATFHAWAAMHRIARGPRVATESESEAALRSLYEGPARRPRRDLPGIAEVRAQIRRWEAYGGAMPRGPALALQRLTEARLVPTWALLPSNMDLPSFPHVLVDESQDVTPLEAWLADESIARGGELLTVGSEDQAIMGWRHAEGIRAFRTLVSAEPEEHALTTTFRFGYAIAKFSNELSRGFGGQEITPAAPHPTGEVSRVQHLSEITFPPGESAAMLSRTNAECAEIARAMPDAVHVRRDPTGDPFASDADRFEAVARAGQIAVATIHSAKGREWDHVVVAHEIDACDADEEEQRVHYVAVSRARRLLTIVEGW